MAKLRKNLLAVFKIIFAAGLIIYLISSGGLNLHSMGKVMAHPWWLSLVTLLWGSLVVITSIRWYLLLLVQGVMITFGKTLSLNFIGMFFNLCLPGSTGGDLVKCYYLASIFPGKKMETITTVLIDRILGVAGLLLVGGVSVLAYPAISLGGNRMVRAFSFSILAVCIATLLGLILLLNLPGSFLDARLERHSHRLLWNMLLRCYRAVRVYRDKQFIIYCSLFLSALVHTIIIITSFIIGRVIGSTLSWRFYGIITPLGLVAGSLPIAPAGLGVGEAAFEYLYKLVGSPLGLSLIHI